MGELSATFRSSFPKIFLFLCISFNEIHAQATVPWYENLPAVAMDYKVHIDPGKEDCYYQYANPGSTIYVSFQASFLYSKNVNCVKNKI